MAMNFYTFTRFTLGLLKKIKTNNAKGINIFAKHKAYKNNPERGFQELVKEACFKRNLHWYSQRTGRTATMSAIEDVIESDQMHYFELKQKFISPGKDKPDYSNNAMRYFALNGSLEGFDPNNNEQNKYNENYFAIDSKHNPFEIAQSKYKKSSYKTLTPFNGHHQRSRTEVSFDLDYDLDR
ncbi:hypothetical protein AVI51_12685 [Piscirickettsia salmonis]|uniref:Uncharacterized protein n=1 Tax=Piscirickettsia salmonis TaxID=1238 RepID=A0A9Q6LQS1_PISSA|nr:hypothetical protein [Piscirickettsia salmonis]ALA26129.1 DeoR family transcriptional regulator [Piscirickettsia salmonis]APS43577.1 hypothetical protein AVI48_03790 [Piscirickettsia salmonis]APS46930.1 hypothetical protein AVI49_04400 [Piscirickettsia salmonis]APS51618.1 hypothetical protein AVI50_12800 [Piscirickettsia salmonis]APS54835.1 hypothetical protein AVI51_12685 [Piscirickettsia salmonis]